MSDRDGKRGLILGASGSGKSYLAKQMVNGLDRVVVFDPEEEYAESMKNAIVIEETDGKAGIVQLGALLYDCNQGSFRVVYVPRDLPQLAQIDLHNVCMVIEALQYDYKSGKMDLKTTLVVDELHHSFPLHVKPDYSGFASLARKGRKRGINVIGITPSPADINPVYRKNLNWVFCFGLADPLDWQAVRKMMGEQAEQAARRLKEWGHIAWERGGKWTEKPPI